MEFSFTDKTYKWIDLCVCVCVRRGESKKLSFTPRNSEVPNARIELEKV